jgi:hypothetical protein
MIQKAECDLCGAAMHAWSELRLDPSWLEFLATFPEFEHKADTVFRFCLCCGFSAPSDNADSQRLISLVKATL